MSLAVRSVNLWKTYGSGSIMKNKAALSGIGIRIPTGIIYGLIGPVGAGKTTLFNMMVGLIKPTIGKLYIFEQDVTSIKSDYKHRVGYVPEEMNLPHYSLYDFVFLSGLLSGLSRSDARRRTKELLKWLDLIHKSKQIVSELSKNLQKRALVAAALIHNPDLLILDEPTTSMDIFVRGLISEKIKELRENGKTVIIGSHVLSEIEMMCDRIGIMHKGRLIFEGTVDEVTSTFNIQKPDSLVYIIRSEKQDILKQCISGFEGVKKIVMKFNSLFVQVSGDAIDSFLKKVQECCTNNDITLYELFHKPIVKPFVSKVAEWFGNEDKDKR